VGILDRSPSKIINFLVKQSNTKDSGSAEIMPNDDIFNKKLRCKNYEAVTYTLNLNV
jgi:hypothetical protein